MTRIVYQIVSIVFVVVFSPVSYGFEGIDLANMDGWVIVIDDNAIESEQYAARELQRFYKQASGTNLPIVNMTDSIAKNIFIGESAAMGETNVGFSTNMMGEEAFRILITSDNIAIAGGKPRGTLYGVYTFVEDYLGVRFLTPDHTHVPLIGKWHGVAPVDRSYDPPLVFRWSYWYPTNTYPVFATRTRCNTVSVDRSDLGGVCKYRLTNHSLYEYINTKEYGEQHPEYFALIDGKRRSKTKKGSETADGSTRGTQLCMSNPEVIRIITEKVLNKLRHEPDLRFISLAQGDNKYYCQCNNCAVIDEHEESHMGSLLTGINAIAGIVEQDYPDVMIGTLAYWYSRKPPKNLRARDNVQIQLANIECSITKPLLDSSSERNVEFVEDLAKWQQKANNINVWTYSTNFNNYLLPCPTLSVWESNIEFYVAHGVNQLFVQGAYQSPGGAFGELTNYVLGKLLWNPSLDSDELIDEFLRLHYGQAAPPIRRYLTLLLDHAAAEGIDQNCSGDAADFAIDQDIVQKGLDAYNEAMCLAENDEIIERLDMVNLWVNRAAIEDAWLAAKSGEVDPEIQQRTRPHIRELFKIASKHDGVIYWRERKTMDQAEQTLREGFGLKENEPW